MSKCIGDCARCELPVDKSACCAFQTFKNILEMKSRMKSLEDRMESLEKKSLVKRVVDVKNNRLVKKIILTNKGEGILFSLWEKINPVFTKTFESFTDEEVEFTKKILKKMRDTLKETVEVQI